MTRVIFCFISFDYRPYAMPFDPVRDAVLNSPATEGLPTSPSLARRATHLSVLLNSDSEPLPRPSSSLSQSLHFEPTDKLVFSKPLKKAHDKSVSPSNSRPSSSSSFLPTSTDFPVMRSSPLLYNPTHRLTPPTSILIPMSKAEMEMYKSYVGKGTDRLTKRKRSKDDADTADEPPVKKYIGRSGVVVEHCTFLNVHSQLVLCLLFILQIIPVQKSV